MPDRSISPISKSTKVTKVGLVDIINDVVEQVNEFYTLYDKYFSEVGGDPTYIQQIEAKVEAISEVYKDLFGTDPTKVKQVETAVAEVKEYHKKLLEGDDSIKADIEDSQEAISNFYNTLFSTSDGTKKDGGQEAIVNKAVKSITDFNTLLNTESTGYKATIETAKQEILAVHSSLFGKDKKSNKSKTELLDEQIVKTHEYYKEATDEILPFIKKKRTEIDEVSKDISNKRSEVDSLLSKATVRTLAQGYMEAMQIYGSPSLGAYPKSGKIRKMGYSTRALAVWTKYFVKFAGSYILFIGPLIAIGVLFVTNGESIFGVDVSKKVNFSGTEYIVYKLTIALPLLWVSWFGQRSIAHRKRLFEEYNHKLRVVQMYMLFTAKEGTYALEKQTRKILEDKLLETIARNPSEVYGKDETMLDKVIDIFAPRRGQPARTDTPQPAPARE